MLKVPPDFIIAGAMKCGTTSLHALLEQHPDVFMPEGEVKFFTIDDFEQQPQFFPLANGRWTTHDFDARLSEYLLWYQSLYSAAPAGAVRGEDAPSYLCSVKAPGRIAAMAPDVKLIVMLRDPVDRAYSHYWHNVRNLRMFLTFDDALRFAPDVLIDRSCYKRQVERYLALFARQQLMFVVFEDFVRDQVGVTREIARYLGLTDFDFAPSHANAGSYPKRPRVTLLRNYLLRERYGHHYRGRAPGMPAPEPMTLTQRMVSRVATLISPFTLSSQPPMKDETKRFLRTLLRRENEGLDELIGRDLSVAWPTFRIDPA